MTRAVGVCVGIADLSVDLDVDCSWLAPNTSLVMASRLPLVAIQVPALDPGHDLGRFLGDLPAQVVDPVEHGVDPAAVLGEVEVLGHGTHTFARGSNGTTS